MKHAIPRRRNAFAMLEAALEEGWQPVTTIPLAQEGEFEVMTLSGLIRRARNQKTERRTRAADGWGPERVSVIGVASGNYLAAIAWRWPEG